MKKTTESYADSQEDSNPNLDPDDVLRGDIHTQVDTESAAEQAIAKAVEETSPAEVAHIVKMFIEALSLAGVSKQSIKTAAAKLEYILPSAKPISDAVFKIAQSGQETAQSFLDMAKSKRNMLEAIAYWTKRLEESHQEEPRYLPNPESCSDREWSAFLETCVEVLGREPHTLVPDLTKAEFESELMARVGKLFDDGAEYHQMSDDELETLLTDLINQIEDEKDDEVDSSDVPF